MLSKTLTTKTGAELKVGDILRDDIFCRIESVMPHNYDETAVMVEDGNGYRYMIRIGLDITYTVGVWSDEDWAAYRAA